MSNISSPKTPVNTLDIALACLTRHPDWQLFPLRAGEKSPPLFERNLELASNQQGRLRQWHGQSPGCNWGNSLGKSGLIVVDVDIRDDKHGQESLDRLELENGPLPETYMVRSPSGGLHYYFRATDDVPPQQRKNAFGQDIDSPGYVLVPGCRINGSPNAYTVIRDVAIAPAPEWFNEYLRPTEATSVEQVPAVDLDTGDIIARAIDFLQHDAPPSIEGQNGEYTTLMVYGRLKDFGVSMDRAIDLVEEYYNVEGRCEPRWECFDGEVKNRHDIKARNAYGYLTGTQPGALSPWLDFGEDPPDAADTRRMIEVWRRWEAAQHVKVAGFSFRKVSR